MAGDDWSRDEVEATVGDYFAMLRDELAGLVLTRRSTMNGFAACFAIDRKGPSSSSMPTSALF